MGTSHRQAPVKDLVGRVRTALPSSSRFPTATRWRSATAAPRRSGTPRRPGSSASASHHLIFGEFCSKFAKVTVGAPFLPSRRLRAPSPAARPHRAPTTTQTRSAWAHNETSTGVMVPVERPEDAGDALVLIDATSGAGGLPLDPAQADVYYFAPQKSLRFRRRHLARAAEPRRDRTDRGARRRRGPLASRVPEALDRARQLPQGPDLQHARDRHAHPACRAARLDERRRRPRLVRRADEPSSSHLYGWAEASEYATPFVGTRRKRSLVVGTIDFDDAVDAAALAATLRANGIVDTEPYRKLGRNQLRIGMFPAIEPADVEALTACIDWVSRTASGVRRRHRRSCQGEDRRLRRRAAARGLRRRPRPRLG